MARLLGPPPRSAVDADELDAYDRVASRFGTAGAVGYFGALLNSPAIAEAVNGGSLAFRAAEQRGTLPTRLREWVDLVVAHELDSAWLFAAHVPAARACGITAPEMRALRAGRYDDLGPEDAATARFVAQVTRGEVSDESFAAVRARLGDRSTVELTGFACWVAMNTRLAQALGQPTVSEAVLTAAIDAAQDG